MPQVLCVLMISVTLWCTSPALVWGTDSNARRPNVIFILTDDQRYDALGFLNPIIDTPNMDRLADEGVHFRNAFVTTALCSPSRASILTGQYMHNHGVVDNNSSPGDGAVFFPEFLRRGGYSTAFIGKWHMGDRATASTALGSPQPGFDHWVSFAGQGEYYPNTLNGKVHQLNINGSQVDQKGYITDELTDYALDWLNSRSDDAPFFMYLSHKAVHANFSPAERHRTQYSDRVMPVPESQADNAANYAGKPLWVRNQRNSWHGVDFPYHNAQFDAQAYLLQYFRTLSAVDDSLGRLLDWLEASGQADNTLIMLMGDNGFMFGEHGLIDKRAAYEESMRVPLLARGPGLAANLVVDEIVANIDIAPTILEVAGVAREGSFDGRSLYRLARGEAVKGWREELLYEYYWEFNFPSTPTTFALRTDDYKFVQYHGVWDVEELYDLREDPKEMRNLIHDPNYLPMIADLRARLYARLGDGAGEHKVPYTEKYSTGAVLRHKGRSGAGEFPEEWLRTGEAPEM